MTDAIIINAESIKKIAEILKERQKLLDGRWFESIKALALLDERLTDLEPLEGYIQDIWVRLKRIEMRLIDLEEREVP